MRVLADDRIQREQRYAAKWLLAAFPRSATSRRARVVVLCYHSVHPSRRFASATPSQFEDHVRWLTQHCDVVPFGRVVDRASEPRVSGRPTVAITFDDGYDDNYEHAFPVLLRHGITASFFLTTGFIDREDAAVDQMRRLRRTPVEPLAWEHVIEMHQAGMEIGSHAVTHRNLAELAAADVSRELRDSKHELEDRLGEEVPSLAYPFGIPGRHVTEQTVSLAAACGYSQGASILYREVRARDHPLQIPRFAVKHNGLMVLRGKIVGNLDVIGRRQERPVHGSTRE